MLLASWLALQPHLKAFKTAACTAAARPRLLLELLWLFVVTVLLLRRLPGRHDVAARFGECRTWVRPCAAACATADQERFERTGEWEAACAAGGEVAALTRAQPAPQGSKAGRQVAALCSCAWCAPPTDPQSGACTGDRGRRRRGAARARRRTVELCAQPALRVPRRRTRGANAARKHDRGLAWRGRSNAPTLRAEQLTREHQRTDTYALPHLGAGLVRSPSTARPWRRARRDWPPRCARPAPLQPLLPASVLPCHGHA